MKITYDLGRDNQIVVTRDHERHTFSRGDTYVLDIVDEDPVRCRATGPSTTNFSACRRLAARTWM